MVTKEEFLQKSVAKDVIKNKMITVADQMFIEYQKELDNSNEIIKGHEEYSGDNKMINVIIDRVCGDNVEQICSEKDEIYKNNSINRIVKILNNNKRELKTRKKLL